MATQGISVYENASIPATPAAGYRVLYPVSTGWKELDSAGNARFFAELDADNASLTLAGNLTFSAASPRIKWTNSATISERLFFQTSTADANSVFHVAPNGAGTQSSIALHNSSDTTNYTRLFIGANASDGFIQTGNFGTGAAIPLSLYSTGVLGLQVLTTGYVSIPTGLNVGSATGAGTGEMRQKATSIENWIERAADTNYGMVTWLTGGLAKWGIGQRATSALPAANDFSIYNGTTSANALTIDALDSDIRFAASGYFAGGLNVGLTTGYGKLHASQNISETSALSISSTAVAKISNPNNTAGNYSLIKFSGPDNDTSVLLGSRLNNASNGDSSFVVGVRNGGGVLSNLLNLNSSGDLNLSNASNGSLSMVSAGLADGATMTLCGNGYTAIALILDTASGISAIYELRAGANAVNEIADPVNFFFPNNDATVGNHIYYNGAGNYVLTNKSGITRVYAVLLFKA